MSCCIELRCTPDWLLTIVLCRAGWPCVDELAVQSHVSLCRPGWPDRGWPARAALRRVQALPHEMGRHQWYPYAYPLEFGSHRSLRSGFFATLWISGLVWMILVQSLSTPSRWFSLASQCVAQFVIEIPKDVNQCQNLTSSEWDAINCTARIQIENTLVCPLARSLACCLPQRCALLSVPARLLSGGGVHAHLDAARALLRVARSPVLPRLRGGGRSRSCGEEQRLLCCLFTRLRCRLAPSAARRCCWMALPRRPPR